MEETKQEEPDLRISESDLKVNLESESLNKNNGKITQDSINSTLITPNVCFQPIQVIGIQKETPVAWSSDGKTLAFVSGNNALYICKTILEDEKNPTVQLDKIITGPKHETKFLSFHPTDPNTLLSGEEDGSYFWNVEKGELIQSLTTNSTKNSHEGGVTCCCWLLDGLVLATGSKDNNIKLWRKNHRWECIETMYGHKATVLSITYCRESMLMFSAGRDSTIKEWNIASIHPQVIDKRLDDGSISCNLNANMEGHRGDVVTLSVTEDGRLIFSGARDNTIKVWDVIQHRELRTIKSHMADIRRLILLVKEQYLYSCSLDGTIKLWKIYQSDVIDDQLTEEDIERNREDADKRTLDEILNSSGISSDILNNKSEQSDELMTTIQAHSSDVFAMEVNPVFPLLATTSNHQVKVWNISNIAQPVTREEFIGHSDAVTGLYLMNQDTQMISCSLDYMSHLYDVESIQRKNQVEFKGSVLSMVITPDNKLMFGSGIDYNIRGFPIDGPEELTFKNVVTLSGHSGRVYCLAISPDGKLLVSGAHDYSICTWEVKDAYVNGTNTEFSPKQRVEAHEGHVMCLSFSEPSSNGVLLASGGNDHFIRIWRVVGYKLSLHACIKDAHESVVSCLVWGKKSSNKYMYSGSWDKTIKVWDSSSNNFTVPLEVLEGHTGRITQLSTTKSGESLISTSADGTAILWNACNPFRALCTYAGFMTDGVIRALSVGEEVFATGFEDGMMKIWPIMKDRTEEADEYKHLFTSVNTFITQRSRRSTGISIKGLRKSSSRVTKEIENEKNE